MLLQLRDYIQQAKLVSLEQIAREFHIANEAVQPMLDIWVSKGVVQRLEEAKSCQRGCISCKPKQPIYYLFIS